MRILGIMKLNLLALVVLILSTKLYAKDCISDVQKVNLNGIYINQNVDEIPKTTSTMIFKKPSVDIPTEGTLMFKDKNDSFGLDLQHSVLGNIYINWVSFNVKNNKVISYSFDINKYLNKKIKDDQIFNYIGIPKNEWVKSSINYGKDSGENLEYSYVCDAYRIVLDDSEYNDKYTVSLYGNNSSDYQIKPVLLPIDYHFKAIDLLNRENQKKYLDDNSQLISIYEISRDDPVFFLKLRKVFLDKLNLDIEKFDMTSIFQLSDIKDDVLTFYMYQKNETYLGQRLTAYIAYAPKSNDILVVTTNDTNNQVKIYGEKTYLLVEALVKSKNFPVELSNKVKPDSFY